MPIKVEKNVPLPPRGPYKVDSEIRTTLLALEIGDSFWISAKDVGKSWQSNVVQMAARCDRRVTTRREKDGWRVWRTK